MWVRIDDQMHSHPKVIRAWQACGESLGLHLLALSYAGCHLTDGHVSVAFVRYQLPQSRARARAVTALVEAGLWEPNGDGWIIHDYLEYNESRDQITARRRRDSVRKRNGIRMES